MKKFYMLIAFAFATASVFLSSSSELQAQCPAGPFKVFRSFGYGPTGQPVSFVYIEGFQPNANITIWENGAPIGNQNPPTDPAVTDATGKGKIIYSATRNPTSVVVSTIVGACEQPVPPAAPSCTGTLFNANLKLLQPHLNIVPFS
jgi:hypothetical protein